MPNIGRSLIIAGLCLLAWPELSSAENATPTAEGIIRDYDDTRPEVRIFSAGELEGAGAAFEQANNGLLLNNEKGYYCANGAPRFDAAEMAKTLRWLIDREPAVRPMPYPVALLLALQLRFPCPN
jgi:hypothetical protein